MKMPAPAQQPPPADRPFVLFVSNATGFRVGRIMQGVALECRKQNLGLLWRDSENCDLPGMRHRPLGVVTWDKLAGVQRLVATAGALPIVSTIGLTLDMSMPTVAADPKGIAGKVAAHLIEEGLRNFLFVGPKPHPAARLRGAAFESALRARLDGIRLQSFSAPFDEQFWGADTDRGRAFIAVLRKETLPVGVFAFNDQIAASCMECVESAGWRVPQDISIVGVDDHPLYTKMYRPLTSVKVDYEEIGRQAVLLIQKMRAPGWRANGPLHHFVGGEELVVRQSSRPRLLGDEQISRALHFLHERYREAVTLRMLSQVAGMSRTTFALRFKHAVGESPTQYLVNLRITQAKLLLVESTKTVSQIGYEVGFNDPGYFTRMFKRRCKVTAKEFRAREVRD